MKVGKRGCGGKRVVREVGGRKKFVGGGENICVRLVAGQRATPFTLASVPHLKRSSTNWYVTRLRCREKR